jgi:hypothetical protein
VVERSFARSGIGGATNVVGGACGPAQCDTAVGKKPRCLCRSCRGSVSHFQLVVDGSKIVLNDVLRSSNSLPDTPLTAPMLLIPWAAAGAASTTG